MPDCPACKSPALEIVQRLSADLVKCWCAVCAKTCWVNLRTGEDVPAPLE